MPLFSSNDTSANPEIRQVEQLVAREARSDQKNLDHTIKGLVSAEKSHDKSIKAADKAQHQLDKAVQKEHAAAKALNKAGQRHDAAIGSQQAAAKSVELKQQHEARLQRDLEMKRAQMEDLKARKETNDRIRESKLSQIHAQAAAALEARTNTASTLDHSPTDTRASVEGASPQSVTGGGMAGVGAHGNNGAVGNIHE